MTRQLVVLLSLVLCWVMIASAGEIRDADRAPVMGQGPLTADYCEPLFYMDAETPTGDIRLLGVEFVDGLFYVTGALNGGDGNIYVLNTDGDLIDQWPQASGTYWQMRDLMFDGEFLYGSDETGLWQIDPSDGSQTWLYAGPVAPNRALAYNPETGTYFTASYSSSIYEVDLATGATVNTYANPGLALYGMAWDDVSEGGPFLWGFSQDGSPGLLWTQFDPATGTPTGVVCAGNPPDGGIAGGATFTTRLVPGWATLVGMAQASPDGITAYELGPANSFALNLQGGTFPPGFDDFGVVVTMNSGEDVMGIQMTIAEPTTEQGFLLDPTDVTSLVPNFDVTWNSGDGWLELIMVDPSGGSIPPLFNEPILEILYNVDTTSACGDDHELLFDEIIVADLNGDELLFSGGGAIAMIGRKAEVNCDAVVDIVDLLWIIDIILDWYYWPDFYEGWAADVNDDGWWDIFDLVMAVNVAIDDAFPKVTPSSEISATVSTPDIVIEKKGIVPVELNSSGKIAGLQMVLRTGEGTTVTPALTQLSNGYALKYREYEGEMVVLLFDLEGRGLPSGDILSLNVSAKGEPDISIESVKVSDARGNAVSLDQSFGAVTGTAVATSYALGRNYPNPFNPETRITYSLPEASDVTLKIYNVLGNEVKTLVSGDMPAGVHEVTWDATNDKSETVATGVYLYRLETASFTKTMKMVLMK